MVAGSNPVTPTNWKASQSQHSSCFEGPFLCPSEGMHCEAFNGNSNYTNNIIEKQSQLRILSEDQIDQTVSQLEAASIRVWAYEGALYIESDRRARAEVYTRSGALYKRIDVAEGQTREPLAEGFYVVVIDGKTHKVIVK